jgi:hypothetical protein
MSSARADGFVDTNREWYVASAGAVSRVVNERVASLVTLSGHRSQMESAEPDGSVLYTGRGYTYTFAGMTIPACRARASCCSASRQPAGSTTG